MGVLALHRSKTVSSPSLKGLKPQLVVLSICPCLRTLQWTIRLCQHVVTRLCNLIALIVPKWTINAQYWNTCDVCMHLDIELVVSQPTTH